MKESYSGQCACGETRYQMLDRPLITHACHCRACQRQTGSTNAVNALIEKHKVKLISGRLIEHRMKTPSGYGQLILRCAYCHTAVWSEYKIFAHRRAAPTLFVRVGTLDDPEVFPPDVNIYTATRQAHAVMREDIPSYLQFYPIDDIWSPLSLLRLQSMQEARRSRPVEHPIS